MSHSDEQRIRRLLEFLIHQNGKTIAQVEAQLGWPAGRLSQPLQGVGSLALEDVLAVLPAVGLTPGEFFLSLYGSGRVDSAPSEEAMARRFQRSLRVVREAIAKREKWKREREGSPST
jgi:hypothetical protein